MRVYRVSFFFLLICGVVALTLIFIEEKPQPPFSRSFAPLFQELGKPVKSVDRAISRILPIEEIDEKVLGEELKLRFIEISKRATPDEMVKVKYLNSLVRSLLDETRRSFEYQVFLVDGPPNAFAMPGGVLCITSSLMDLLENEAELVAVLGHEMGHVERGHLFDAARGEMLRRKIGSTTLLSYASDVIGMIMLLSFSKTQEDEADEYAFRLLVKKGYDPIAISTAFEKLASNSCQKCDETNLFEDFFCSHPHIEHRIEKFRSLASLWKVNHPSEELYLGEKNFKEQILKESGPSN